MEGVCYSPRVKSSVKGPDDLLGAAAHPSEVMIDSSVTGWQALTDVSFLLQMAGMLAAAILLAAAIAYHPVTRKRASTLEEIEQPKTFLVYAMVGAIVALIVRVQPSMALVVFGIGGLMRFRTQVGQAKDTGRTILVTVVGLCCGLELYAVALMGTLFGWVLVFVLERSTVERMVVQGIDVAQLQRAAGAYGQLLNEAGCQVLGEQKNVKKGMVSFIVRLPAGAEHRALQSRFEAMDADLQGAIHWENS